MIIDSDETAAELRFIVTSVDTPTLEVRWIIAAADAIGEGTRAKNAKRVLRWIQAELKCREVVH